MDTLDGFFELPDEGNEPETITETAPEAVAETVTDSVETPTETVDQADTTASEDDRKNWAPVAALREEREKARLAREETEQLRQRIAQIEQAQQATNAPDPFDDPTGYHAYMQDQIRREIASEMAMANFNQSRERALEKYGADELEKLAEWADAHAQTNPNFGAEVFAQRDPVEFVIAQRKRTELLKSIEANPDAYVLRSDVELGLVTPAVGVAVTAATPATKPIGPMSLNNAKSRDVSSKSAITSAEEGFDAIFKK